METIQTVGDNGLRAYAVETVARLEHNTTRYNADPSLKLNAYYLAQANDELCDIYIELAKRGCAQR